jgi:hypothetical protein
LNAWFDRARPLRPVYTLYFSALYSERMYLESEFLSLAQALETFHRNLYGVEGKQYSLKDRLDDLSRRTPPLVRRLVVEDFDAFTKRVKDTRHLFTHHSPQRRPFTDEELFGASRRVRLWLMALLFLEVGLEEAVVIEALKKYKKLRFPTELLP